LAGAEVRHVNTLAGALFSSGGGSPPVRAGGRPFPLGRSLRTAIDGLGERGDGSLSGTCIQVFVGHGRFDVRSLLFSDSDQNRRQRRRRSSSRKGMGHGERRGGFFYELYPSFLPPRRQGSFFQQRSFFPRVRERDDALPEKEGRPRPFFFPFFIFRQSRSFFQEAFIGAFFFPLWMFGSYRPLFCLP